MHARFAGAVLFVLLTAAAAAADKVLTTVRTVHSGLATVTCDNPGGWTFDVRAATDDGRDVVTVTISSPVEAPPPKFGVQYRVSGAGVQNVWTGDANEPGDGRHLWPQCWWGERSTYSSQLARQTPIAVGFNSCEVSPVALACSEAFNYLEYGLCADDRTCEIVGRCEFFLQPVAAAKSYEVSVLLDRRGRSFSETVRACSEWVARQNGFVPADVPETAFEPLYSTWYAYLQDIHAGELEAEARRAADLGMKVMIIDDGWQKDDSVGFYTKAGDWMPALSRFPDIRGHVRKIHEAGLKAMLWVAVPFMGREAQNAPRFTKMMLRKSDSGILDPRFPEVRDYLIGTCRRIVGEWGFDGLKLDFIDLFQLPEPDPALADGYAGRDYRSLPAAVDRLMKDILAAVKAVRPDVLVEFRQAYMGPAMLQYGNMMRVADCPADPSANRRRMCDLRLTSGPLAVHSDMLVWSRDETPEGAALPILNVLFSTIQYSMILAKLSPEHTEVIRHWIGFCKAHREALLKGAFRPHHAENGYTWIEGESAQERIIAAYSDATVVSLGRPDKTILVVNATGTDRVAVEAEADGEAELFDTFGKSRGRVSIRKGLFRLGVPPSGYACIRGTQGRGAAAK